MAKVDSESPSGVEITVSTKDITGVANNVSTANSTSVNSIYSTFFAAILVPILTRSPLLDTSPASALVKPISIVSTPLPPSTKLLPPRRTKRSLPPFPEIVLLPSDI